MKRHEANPLKPSHDELDNSDQHVGILEEDLLERGSRETNDQGVGYRFAADGLERRRVSGHYVNKTQETGDSFAGLDSLDSRGSWVRKTACLRSFYPKK